MTCVQAWGGGGGAVIKKLKGNFMDTPMTQFNTHKISTAGGKTNQIHLKSEVAISTLMTLDARSGSQKLVVITLNC